MTRKQFNDLVDAHLEDILEIQRAKGKDYAGDTDALANFKNVAKQSGLTTYQVWSVYANKHIDAINSFVRNGQTESEPIESRVHDTINYLLLLLGLLADDFTDRIDGEDADKTETCWLCDDGPCRIDALEDDESAYVCGPCEIDAHEDNENV